MNKRCYKVIFSKTLNCLVVVSEWAKSSGKSDNRISSPQPRQFLSAGCYAMQRLSVNVLLSLGLATLSFPVSATISEDSNAPRNQQPMVVQTASGITQVNIQTPSAAGVSMNQYSQFDVDNKGAVLANNRKATKAHIAGWVDANPYMARGEADVIVNQVNSNNPSQLQGYVEVAGKRADVIIANPSGIGVNGGGFLNVNKTILSTGQTQIHNGKVTGHSIKQSKITIAGQGLDVRDGNYTALLSRSAEINAGVYKGDGTLDVITGVNDVDVSGNITHSTAVANDDKKPTVAIDTGKLGGMYAGSIHLVGTETGIGVNNAGQIQTNQLTLSADGKLSNSGQVVANKTSDIKNSALYNSGTLNTAELQLSTSKITNSGSITQTGSQSLTITAQNLTNSGGVGISKSKSDAANNSSNNTSSTTNSPSTKSFADGHINVTGNIENTGDITAGGNIVLSLDDSLSNSGAIKVEKARLGNGKLKSGKLENSGELFINQAHLNGTQLDNKGSATISINNADAFNFTQRIDNAGQITVTDTINWDTKQLNNTDTGTIYTDKTFALIAQQTDNAGQLVADDNLAIKSKKTKNTGNVQSQKQLSITGSALENKEKGQLTAQQITIDSATIDNAGKINQVGNGNLAIATDNVSNTGSVGKLPQGKDTSPVKKDTSAVNQKQGKTTENTTSATDANGTITSKNLTNTGAIVNNGTTTLTVNQSLTNKTKGAIDVDTLKSTAQKLDNSGSLYANNASLSGSVLNNSGTLSVKQIKEFNYSTKIDNTGEILGKDSFTVQSPLLFNSGKINGVESIKLIADDVTNNAEILAQKSITIEGVQPTSSTVKVNNSGTLTAGKQIDFKVNTLTNSIKGAIQSQLFTINSDDVSNDGSIIQTGKNDLSISADKVENQKSGVLGKNASDTKAEASNNTLTDSKTADKTTDKKTDNANKATGTIAVNNTLTNSGKILAGGDVSLATGSKLSNQGQIAVAQFTHKSGKLDNSGGQLSADTMSLLGTVLDNNKGTLQSNTFSQFNFVDMVKNQAGKIIGQADYSISTQHLDNTAKGTVSGANNLNIKVDTVDTDGVIIAGNNLTINADTTKNTTINNQGYIGAGNTLGLRSNTIDNSGDDAQIIAKKLQVTATHLSNSGTIVQNSEDTLTITADKAENTNSATLGTELLDASKSSQANKQTNTKNDTVQKATGTKEAGFITVADTLTNSHKIIANGKTQLHTKAGLTNAGTINVNKITHDSGTLQNTGTLRSEEASLNGQLLANTGQIDAARFSKVSFDTLDNSGQLSGAKSYAIKATTINNKGKESRITSREKLNIQAQKTINDGSIVATDALTLNTDTLRNNSKATVQGKSTEITATTSIINDGIISAETTQKITTQSLTNNKTLGATESQTIKADSIKNKGDIVAKQLTVDTKTINNAGSIKQTDAIGLSIRAKNLDNQATGVIGHTNEQSSNTTQNTTTTTNAGSQSSNTGRITATEKLTNTGTIDTGAKVDIYTDTSFNNAGTITASHLDSEGNTFTNSGTITADTADLSILERFLNQFKLLVKGDAKVSAKILDNEANATLKSEGGFVYDGKHLTNRGSIMTGGKQSLTVDKITNSGLIAVKDKQTIRATQLDNQKDGEINASSMDWQLGTLTNNGMVVHTGQSPLSITATAVDNKNVIARSPKKLDNKADSAIAPNANTGSTSNNPNNTSNNTPPQSSENVIKVSGKLNNKKSGYIVSNNEVNLTASKSLTNSGQIAVDHLTVTGDALTNSKDIDAKTITVDNAKVDNTGLIVADTATINSTNLENNQGMIGVVKKLVVAIKNVLNNNNGQLLSKNNSTITAQTLTNQAGKVQAANTNTITANTIDNRGGDIYGKNVTADFNTLDNRRLDNRSNGRVAGKNTVALTGTQRIENNGGELVAGNSLTITDKGTVLDVNNTNGKIRGQDVSLTAKSLTGDAGVLATRDLGIHLKDDVNLTTDKVVNGSLDITSKGTIDNTVTLSGKDTVHIKGQTVNNKASGNIISTNKTHIEAGNATNEGTINSNGVTHLDVNNTLSNQATGKIYGDTVAIEADTLTNNKAEQSAGVIGARKHLAIGAKHINNYGGDDKIIVNGKSTPKKMAQGKIVSQGSLSIGGELDANLHVTGQADTLVNNGGLIEAQGNGDIAVKNLQNLNSYFDTDYLPPKIINVVEYADSKKGEKYRHGVDGTLRHSGRKELYFDFYDPNLPNKYLGSTNVHWWKYKQYTYKEKIIANNPGRIIVGGSLNIDGNTWENNNSQIIIGSSLLGNKQLIKQVETKAKKKIEKHGEKGDFVLRKKGWFGHRYSTPRSLGSYNPKPIITDYDFENPITVQKSNVSNPPLSGTTPASADIKPAIETAKPADRVSKKEITFKTLSKIDIALPKDGLFTVDADNSDVLIKTDPQFIGGIDSHNSDKEYTSVKDTSEARNPVIKTDDKNTSNNDDPLGIKAALKEQAHKRLDDVVASIDTAVTPQGEAPQRVQTKAVNPAFSAPYIPAKLENNPALKPDMHKRIGDMYYEQRLIQDQITKLTGRRFALGYYNDLEQYKALLDNGAEFAEKYHIKSGVTLSPEQMKRLTSDLVWLENQEVTLPDGSKQMVTVPRVYLRSRNTDVNTAGSLISANHIDLKADSINNQGTMVGFESNNLKAKDINVSGRVVGGSVNIDAENTVDINGGSVIGENSIAIKGKAVDIKTTTASYGNDSDINSGTVVNRVAGVYLTGSDTDKNDTNRASTLNAIVINAENDITLKGANIVNNAKDNGITQLVSEKGSVNIDTVTTKTKEGFGKLTDRNHRRVSVEQEVGSSINSNTNIVIKAGDKVTIRQGDINSSNGLIAMKGGNGVDITEGRSKSHVKGASYSKDRGFLSSTKRIHRYDNQDDLAVSSNITGKKVIIHSGDNADISIRGSNVVSDNGTQLQAGKNVVIEAAENYSNHNEFNYKKKSGIFGTGGLGFTIGSQKNTTDSKNTQVTHTASMVGSVKAGDTTIIAGEKYTQKGSAVTAVDGDVNVLAKQIDVTAIKGSGQLNNHSTFKQKGLTVALSSPVIDAAMAVSDTVKSADNIGKSKNDRVNAMAAANTAFQGFQAVKGLENLQKSGVSSNGITVSISYGEQKNSSETHITTGTSKASTINAGGKVNLVATGGDKSTINIIGSDVAGAKETKLIADHDVNIIADKQSSSERSKNKSAGWNAGVAIAFDNGVSFGVTAGGNKGKGHGNGDDVSYRNSHVGSATGKTTIQAGNKLTLKGAQAIGKSVKVRAKDLDIESLQDSSIYDSKQQNISGQVTVGYGLSASANFSKSKIKADHLSVSEQSGIFAGDDGFDVKIDNHTDLKGGIISSTAKAEAEGKNIFSTGTITKSDLQNHSGYDASGFAIGGGIDIKGGWTGDTKDKQGNPTTVVKRAVGYGKDSDNQNGTTKSGIGTKNITITNVEKQSTVNADLLDINNLTTDITTDIALNDKGLQNTFDKEAVQSEIDLQVGVTQEFDRTRQKVKQLFNEKIEKLKEAVNDGKASQEELDNMQMASLIVDGISGALYTPNANGLIGDVAQVASPFIAKQIGDYFTGDKKGTAAHGLAHTILAAATAAAGGNDTLTAGLTAGASEIAAPHVTKWMYGTDDPNKLTAEQKQTVSNIISLAGTAVGSSTSNTTDAVASGRATQNATDNNYIYHLSDGRILAYDEINNGTLVELTKLDAVDLGLMKSHKHIKDGYTDFQIKSTKIVNIDYDVAKSYISTDNTLNLRNTSDREKAEARFGFNTNISPDTKLVFQNGILTNHNDAINGAQELQQRFNQNSGYINNATINGYIDIRDMYNPPSVKHIMELETYKKLNNNQNHPIIVAHSRGNHDFMQTSKVNFYGEKFTNLHLVSVGSPVSNTEMQNVANKLGINYLGQVNDPKDFVSWFGSGWKGRKNSLSLDPLGEHYFKQYIKEPQLINIINNQLNNK